MADYIELDEEDGTTSVFSLGHEDEAAMSRRAAAPGRSMARHMQPSEPRPDAAPGGGRGLPPYRDASGKLSAYWDEFHPDHKEAVRRVTEGFERAHPESDEPGTQRPVSRNAPTEHYELAAPSVPADAPLAAFAGEYTRDFNDVAMEVGLSKDQAEQVLDAVVYGHETPSLPEYHGSEVEAESVLRREWGEDYEDKLALARWAARVVGVGEALGDSGQSNNPAACRFFARLGAKMNAHAIMQDRRSGYADPTSTDPSRSAIQHVHRLLKLSR